MARGRRPSIDEIIREEMFRAEQEELLAQNPNSMMNNPGPGELEGGVDPSGPAMTDPRPSARWNEKFDDQPTEDATAAILQRRGDAAGREFGPRNPQLRRMEQMNTPPPPPGVGASPDPNAMRGLAGAYNSLPEGSPPSDYGMKVMPQVPQQNMQQLMDFYMNGGSDI